MTARLWLSRLQLSDSSQRLLTEAAADWQHEGSMATSLVCVLRAHLFGTVSILRLLPSVIADSAMPAFHWSWLAALAIWIAALSLLNVPYVDAFLILAARISVPLAILFGPESRRSPFFGFALLQVVLSTVAALDYPRESTALMLQATIGAIMAGALADRIRIDARRESRTLQLAGMLVVVWYVLLIATIALRRNGFTEQTIEHSQWAWFTACLAAGWYWMVRRQETRQWWADLQLWLDYRGERR